MKYLYTIALTVLLYNLDAQELQLVWSSPEGTKQANNIKTGYPDIDGNYLTEDYNQNGTNDLSWYSFSKKAILIVDGGDRSTALEIDVTASITKSSELSIYFIKGLSNESVNSILCNNENFPNAGFRDDNKVILENELLTFPKTSVFISGRDYDLDGKTEIELYNISKKRIELWNLN